ncbi:MAG: hypothetical protein HFP77_02805 [Methylococcales symbiont of Iophon sp. n. MRB-2018]|nr:MAG: hypothetical protein HFP77_02805 [Methylococcales symbiont of Iophon sp. n. MRB-2018]KAF3979894.1 MAG: hypothetical protein HFP76_04820 [Methylococcales symbiont of Iophon sp. n. MRB-2018]
MPRQPRLIIKYHCHLHAYVLMANHLYLLITPKSDDGVSAVCSILAEFMCDILMIYSKEQAHYGKVVINQQSLTVRTIY